MKKQDQLIEELNELYIDLTGDGMSPSMKKSLEESCGESTLLLLIEDKKHIVANAIERANEDVNVYPTFHVEPERCDDLLHY